MTRPDYVHTTIVLDRSGSMAPVRDDTVAGLNHFISEQKRVRHGKATLSLVQFNTETLVTHAFTDLQEVYLLTGEDYAPCGGTALLDAVSHAIAHTGVTLSAMDDDRRPARVNVVVITDGLENASKRVTHAALRERIRHQEERYAWRFVYLGAALDSWAKDAQAMGIAAGDFVRYRNTSIGVRAAYAATSHAVSVQRLAPERDDLTLGGLIRAHLEGKEG